MAPNAKSVESPAKTTNSGPSREGTGVRLVSDLVEESRRRTNRYQISDFIKFVVIPKAVDPAKIKDLYLKDSLTASQIAERVGLSKPAVLARLHQMGVRNQQSRGAQSDNFRFPQKVPFGKRLVNGRLIDDRRELKAARLIVERRHRQNLPWNEVMCRINMAGFKTKRGLPWKIGMLRAVFAKWRDKF